MFIFVQVQGRRKF